MIKSFNKIVWSNEEPTNKNDIWLDKELVIRVYTNGNWKPLNPKTISNISISTDFNNDFNNDFAI